MYGAYPPGYFPYQYYPQPSATEQGPPPVKKRAHDATMVTVGVVMTSVGIASVVVGAVVVALSKNKTDIYCDGPILCGRKDNDTRKTVGVIMMAGGGVLTAIGIPVWAFGAKSERVDGKPSHRDRDKTSGAFEIGPGSVRLVGKF